MQGKKTDASITHDVYTETCEVVLSAVTWAASSPFSLAILTGSQVLKRAKQ